MNLKMLVQCMEGLNPANSHSLGLTPDSYVSDAERKMGSDSWTGVLLVGRWGEGGVVRASIRIFYFGMGGQINHRGCIEGKSSALIECCERVKRGMGSCAGDSSTVIVGRRKILHAAVRVLSSAVAESNLRPK